MGEKYYSPTAGTTIFDITREIFDEAVLDQGAQNWDENAQTAICKVLRSWEMKKSELKNTWVNKVLLSSGAGKDDVVVLFQGRVVSNKGHLGIHSALPDPLYEKGALGAPGEDGEMDFWIDLHPVFVGLLKSGNKAPNPNDYLEVSFNKAFAKSSGEWYGVIKNFINLGGGEEYGASQVGMISPKDAYKATARKESLGPPPSVGIENIPRRFLFIGDEMFGTDTRRVNRSTAFAKKVQGDIRDLYSGLRNLKINADTATGRAKVLQQLEKQFDVPEKLLNDVADKLGAAAGLMPIPDFWNISVAFVDPTFYSSLPAATEMYTGTKGSVILELPHAKLKFNASPSANKSTTPEIIKHGSELITETAGTSSPFWSEEIEAESGWNGSFDFAIVGGPMGYSANPGWAGYDAMGKETGDKFAAYWSHAFPMGIYSQEDMLGGLPTPDYERLQEFVRHVARFGTDDFIAAKQPHYEQILTQLKSIGCKGSIWVGPALGVGRGLIAIDKYKEKILGITTSEERVAVHTEFDVGGYPNLERHKLRVIVKDSNPEAQYSFSPYFDPAFHLRWATSRAILNATADDKKAYNCLAYCTEFYDLDAIANGPPGEGGEAEAGERWRYDSIAKHYNVVPTNKNEIKGAEAQRVYSNWIIRNLCLYLAGKDAIAGKPNVHIDALKGTHDEAISMGDFAKDAQFLDQWADDFADRYEFVLKEAEDIFGYQIRKDKLPDHVKDEWEKLQKTSEELADNYSDYTKEQDDWWWSSPGGQG